jgi:Holliday junction resolvase RusA-like endonuclease
MTDDTPRKRRTPPRVVRRRFSVGLLELVIDVAPKPWARPRFGLNGRAYTPKDVEAHREAIRWQALEGRIRWEHKHARAWPRLAGHEYAIDVVVFRASRRGDWDNFAKQVDDALQGTLFPDDRQIFCGSATVVDPIDEDWNGDPRYQIKLEAFEVVEFSTKKAKKSV